ncbi:MAG TPA: DUF1570 domain-containing protein [Pirellulales bacterium]|jgi:hypothetical protein|nr:DUF1570 domain-containing protein [Pirellulales bacterium]
MPKLCPKNNRRFACFAAILSIALLAGNALAADQITFRRGGKETQISGKLMVTAKDGGVMLLASDGTLWNIEPQEIVDHKQDAEPFAPLSQSEAAKKVRDELPAGFETYTTAHYVICHNTSRAYAQWVGALYERLYTAFLNYWRNRGFKIHDPDLPLLVLVFATRDGYAAQVQPELGASASAIIAFYSLRSNRVTMYDLTGVESLRRKGDTRGSPHEINLMLARPEAEAMVATIIHEATHQLAFNCGLQTRFADIPLWILEGLAVYFETPDLGNSKGWKTIGAVNRARLDRFGEYYQTRRPKKSLLSLISDDTRFRDPQQAVDAYAEAWALNYYLIHQKPKEFLAYMELMAAKKTLVVPPPEQRVELRIKEFKTAFGDDLDRLDADFVKFMQRLR